jgi:3-hydroxybutyrate dehydrogenase
MRARDFGRIVNVASIYGLIGATSRVDYVTTKTALIGFTRAVALETARTNITCNAICPGTIPTPNIEGRLEAERARSGLSRAETEQAFLASRQPSGKFVAPERVAALTALLCSPDGADITGSAIPIDGGWSAA